MLVIWTGLQTATILLPFLNVRQNFISRSTSVTIFFFIILYHVKHQAPGAAFSLVMFCHGRSPQPKKKTKKTKHSVFYHMIHFLNWLQLQLLLLLLLLPNAFTLPSRLDLPFLSPPRRGRRNETEPDKRRLITKLSFTRVKMGYKLWRAQLHKIFSRAMPEGE